MWWGIPSWTRKLSLSTCRAGRVSFTHCSTVTTRGMGAWLIDVLCRYNHHRKCSLLGRVILS